MSEFRSFLPILSPVDCHPLEAHFDGGTLSSDGGVLLLREIARKLDFADMIASCLHDVRDPSRTAHDYASMIRARILTICFGYEDCDDLDILRHDPALKLSCEKLPLAKSSIASQPTLSRLETVPSKG